MPPPPHHLRVPLADGGRVHLRRARLEDAPSLFDAYAGDPSATRFLSWAPRASAEEVARWLAPTVDAWDAGTSFRWVLATHATGPAIGTVVLHRRPRTWTVGYAVGPAAQGRGIATAALWRTLRCAAAVGPAMPVIARTDPAHAASIAVLRRCGFHLDGRELRSWVRPTLGPEPRDALRFRWSPRRAADRPRATHRAVRLWAVGA